MKAFVSWFAALAAATTFVHAEPPANYVQAVEAARAERVAVLTKPDNWLTLIGLHFLPPGESTIGSAKNNAVVLAAGPAHLGKVTLAADGKVTLTIAAGVDAKIDGEAVRAGELKLGEGRVKPTYVTTGTVTFYAVDRGGKKALRVKDSAAKTRTGFVGLD